MEWVGDEEAMEEVEEREGRAHFTRGHFVWQHIAEKESHMKMALSLDVKNFLVCHHTEDCERPHTHILVWYKKITNKTYATLASELGIEGAHCKPIKGKLQWMNAVTYLYKRDAATMNYGPDSMPEQDKLTAMADEIRKYSSVAEATRLKIGSGGRAVPRRARRTSRDSWEALTDSTGSRPPTPIPSMGFTEADGAACAAEDLVDMELRARYGEEHPLPDDIPALPSSDGGGYDWTDTGTLMGLYDGGWDVGPSLQRGPDESRLTGYTGAVLRRRRDARDYVRVPARVRGLPRPGFLEPASATGAGGPPGGSIRIDLPRLGAPGDPWSPPSGARTPYGALSEHSSYGTESQKTEPWDWLSED